MTLTHITGEAGLNDDPQAARYPAPQPAYGFFGRDLDAQHIEKRLSAHNLLLVSGMGGAGKTTLLRHLGHRWQSTCFIDHVFEYGYDTKAWAAEQIVLSIAQQLLPPDEYQGMFSLMSFAAQQHYLADRLNSQRHLLILDNLESITGRRLAIRHVLSEPQRQALKDFLALLVGGKTLVLLGSRGGEDWLKDTTFGENHYDLPGLDPAAATELADEILTRHHATHYRETAAFQSLLTLLNGYPLPMEVVLANLATQTPEAVCAALTVSNVALDQSDAQDKTQNILRYIEYSHSNLSVEAQVLLHCLAPFTGVLFTPSLPDYIEHLKRQPVLATIPFERWEAVQQEAVNWGLCSPHPQVPGFLELQPIFQYFLRTRLREQGDHEQAIRQAFLAHYDELADAIFQWLRSQDVVENQAGQVMAQLEYDNLITALDMALDAQVSILHPFLALSEYLDSTQENERGLAIGERILRQFDHYSADQLAGPLGGEWAAVINGIAGRQLALKQYSAAAQAYQRALDLWRENKHYPDDVIKQLSAPTYQQLGVVAQAQHQWAQAESYYQQALALFIEFNARYEQAGTYHNLGMVAEAQRQWEQAERYYQQALTIKREFGARHEQASTYHQLGRVAEEQRQWVQALNYFLKDLEISAEYEEKEGIVITLHSLARLWTASGDAKLPSAVATILTISSEEARNLLRQVLDNEA